MDERERRAAIYALQQARGGIEVALSMLGAEDEGQPCPHKNRQDLGGFGDQPGRHFYCKDCGVTVDERQAQIPGTDGPQLPD